MGGRPSAQQQEDAEQAQRELTEEQAKLKEQQKQQLDEATRRRQALLRSQLGGAGSLIPSGNGNSTLGG